VATTQLSEPARYLRRAKGGACFTGLRTNPDISPRANVRDHADDANLGNAGVHVPVFMFDFFVLVFMVVLLGQVQPKLKAIRPAAIAKMTVNGSPKKNTATAAPTNGAVE
jgi:hypothetical protein